MARARGVGSVRSRAQAGIKRYDAGGIGAPFLYNAIVFKKVQALLGGKLRAVITGSAPLAPGIQKFAQTVFNCPVRQGYGLTETCAPSCIAEPCDNTCGLGELGATRSSRARLAQSSISPLPSPTLP